MGIPAAPRATPVRFRCRGMAYQVIQKFDHRVTYREFDGDHLLLAKRAHEVQDALGIWLSQQEKADRAPSIQNRPGDRE